MLLTEVDDMEVSRDDGEEEFFINLLLVTLLLLLLVLLLLPLPEREGEVLVGVKNEIIVVGVVGVEQDP